MKKLGLLLLASAASAQEPIKFRGAYIGEALSDFADCSLENFNPITKSMENYAKGSADLLVA